MISGIIWSAVEVAFAVWVFCVVCDMLFGFDPRDVVRRRLSRAASERMAPRVRVHAPDPPAKKRVRMVRDPGGKFVRKAPPGPGDPHTPEEIAAAEAELEAELRRDAERVYEPVDAERLGRDVK